MRATGRALFFSMALVSYGCGRSCNKQNAMPHGPAAQHLAMPLAAALFVTNNGSDTLTILDKNSETRTEVNLDLEAEAHEAPHHVAVDAKARAAFVALSFPAEASKTKNKHAAHGRGENAGRLVRLSTDTLTLEESVDVDENPGDVLLSHDGKRVLVTHFDLGRAFRGAMNGANPATMMASLQIWDAKPLVLRHSRNLCVAPHGIAVTKDDTLAVIACYGSDELAIVDLRSYATERYPLGPSPGLLGAPKYGPYSATLSPNGLQVLVAEQEGQGVRVFDLPSRKFVEGSRMPLGARAMIGVYVTDDVAVVPLQAPDGVIQVKLSNQTVVTRRSFANGECKSPHVAARDASGRLFLVCEGDHVGSGSVLELDDKLATRHAWQVGVYPDGIAFGD